MKHTYMSFGGGVQSTTLALLALNRDERLLRVTGGAVPSLYLFADTGDERLATSAHVERMCQMILDGGAVFEVLRRPESLSQHVLNKMAAGKRGISMPPVYVASESGRPVPVMRGCTSHFKIALLDSHAKRAFKTQRKAGEVITQWYGMSHDEPGRLRTSPDAWRTFAYPLYEMRWTRWHCEQYLATQAYPDGTPVPIVRSSCVYCPFHSLEEWRHVRADADAWARAVAFDDALRAGDVPPAGLKTAAYVFKGRVPQRDAPLDEDTSQLDLFGVGDEECHGVCGV